MYNTMKMQIERGKFRLPDIQYKIKRLYAMGDLSEEQLDGLLTLAAGKADPDTERPELLALIQALSGKITALEQRVKDLEGEVPGSETGEDTRFPAWEPWDGLSSNYQCGAIVEHNGHLWQSAYSGQNVWEPGVVDERFWGKYVPEA